jgi:hypothetical protein
VLVLFAWSSELRYGSPNIEIHCKIRSIAWIHQGKRVKDSYVEDSWPTIRAAALIQEEDPVRGTNTTESAQQSTCLALYQPARLTTGLDGDPRHVGDHIYGYYNVPPGYGISLVPHRATFIERTVLRELFKQSRFHTITAYSKLWPRLVKQSTQFLHFMRLEETKWLNSATQVLILP